MKHLCMIFLAGLTIFFVGCSSRPAEPSSSVSPSLSSTMQTSSVGEETCYLVKTEEDLRAIGSVYPLSGHYRLENDISLTQEWTPIGSPSHPFTGSFDGNGYTISHLTVTTEAEHMGFFGASDGANIQNILLSDVALPETVFFPIVSESVDSDIVNCSISYAS